MALVTGTAADCNLAGVETLGLELVFTLNDAATSDSGIFIDKPVVVPVVNGAWSADLQPTEMMWQQRFYKVSARWLDGLGASFPDWELHVPPAGGSFPELIVGYSQNPYMIFWQPTEPSPWPVGATWANTVTGDLFRKDF